MIQERAWSIVGPYLERLYELIDRKEEDKIFFEEFIHAISAFCLFTKDEMMMFVFKMFDRDRDDFISKKDVFRHLMTERNNQMVYPVNNLRAVELFKCLRGDRIDRKMFLKLIIQPSGCRKSSEKSLSVSDFGNKIAKRVEAKENERKKMEEKKKIKQRQKQREEEIKQERENLFLEHCKNLNEIDAKNKKLEEEEMKEIRNPQRRHTDGFIGVKFRERPLREDIDERLERREELLVKHQANDILGIPLYDRDLHTSFIFDRMADEEVIEKKRILNIDPTDKRFNFDIIIG